MAFDANRLALTVDSIGGGSLRIHFLKTLDDQDAVTTPNYMRFARRLGVREGDIVLVHDETSTDIDTSTYITQVGPMSDLGHASLTVASGGPGQIELPPRTFQANPGDETKGVTYDEAREMLSIDRVANKSESDMVSVGPIADALETKATPADIASATNLLNTRVSDVEQILPTKANSLALDAAASTLNSRVDVVTASVSSKATQSDITTATTPLGTRLSALEGGQAASRITRRTYAEIAALTLSATNTYEALAGDTGTHTGLSSEVGAVGTTVPNAGIFIVVSGALRRIGGNGFADNLSGTPVVTTLPDTQLIPTLSADRKTTTLITLSDLEARLVEKFIDFDVGGTATSAEQLLIPADPTRNGGEILHAGTLGTLFIRAGGSSTKFPVAPGQGYSLLRGRKSDIFVSSDGLDIPLNSFFTNSSGTDVVASRISDAYIARLSGAQSTTELNAIRQFVRRTRSTGAFQNFSSAYLLCGRDRASDLVDMVRLTSATVVGSPTFTYRSGVKFNGTDQYIDTGYSPRDDVKLTISSHSMGVFVVDTEAQAGFAMGTGTLNVGPNRNANQGAFRSATAGANLVDQGRGGFFGLSRIEPARFRAYWNGTAYPVEEPAVTFSNTSLPVLIGASNGASINSWVSSNIAFAFTGQAMNDAQMSSINDAILEYRTAVGAV